MTFVPGQVSALLGHNGAGKTTTISMLTGTLNATGGDALINGKSIRTEMGRIRESLGICPQFGDPLAHAGGARALTTLRRVRGHGQRRDPVRDCLRGERGGVVRKVALQDGAAVRRARSESCRSPSPSSENPAWFFLGEPTSGMDPYSRRFTWEVIRKRAATSSIMLTTHFLDEADLLCDRIAIMSSRQAGVRRVAGVFEESVRRRLPPDAGASVGERLPGEDIGR